MHLTTRCPRCNATFDVSLKDLQLRKGFVRCVQCAHIFDGYAEVVRPENHPGPLPTAPRQPELPQVIHQRRPHTLNTPSPDPAIPERHVIASPQPWHEPAASPRHVVGSPQQHEPATLERHIISLPDGDLADPQPQFSSTEPLDDGAALPYQDGAAPAEAFIIEPRTPGQVAAGTVAGLQPDQPPTAWDSLKALLARLLLVLLLLLLLAQAAYVWRAQLAQAMPITRPWLERACVSLSCQVPYARSLTRAAISGSSLKVVDALPASINEALAEPDPHQHPHQDFILNVSLRNATNEAQEWPNLILDLKDSAGALLVRRNLQPAEYLQAQQLDKPFAALSELEIRLPLRLDGVVANGFELDLFYP